MEVMTLKQFAEAENVSYEAVRRLVTRYAEDLGSHIYVRDNTRFLDEWALAFLREKRRQSPIIRVVEDRGEEIQALQDQIAALQSQREELTARLLAAQDMIAAARKETTEAQDKLIETQRRVIALQENETKYLEARLEVDGIRADRDQKAADLERIQAERDELAEELEAEKVQAVINTQTVQLHREEAEKAQEEAERAREEAKTERQRTETARADAAAAQDQIAALQKEVERFRPSLFGFYRKV